MPTKKCVSFACDVEKSMNAELTKAQTADYEKYAGGKKQLRICKTTMSVS